MKPKSVAIILALVAVFSMCSTPTSAEVIDGLAGKWKASGGTTIFEVFQDGRYKSTINGVVVETGIIAASNGTWSIRADSGRSDKGSFTLNSRDLQLKGELVTTAWNRMPTNSSTSTGKPALTESTGSSATSSTAAATASTGAGSTTPHLSDKEKAIQRFNAKYGAKGGGWVRNPPGGVMNDRQARKFWRGH